jgi:fibronectin-binding autotransporter adhesin
MKVSEFFSNRHSVTLAAFLLAFAFPAQAVYYWDPDGSATGNDPNTGAGLGGTGTWSAAATNWYEADTGFTGETSWKNDGTIGPFFIGTPGVVTLGEPINTLFLTFKTNNYSLTGSVLTLSTNGAGSIDTGGFNATIGSEIAGTVGLEKLSAGTLTLTASNSYSGLTRVIMGTLTLSSAYALGSATNGAFVENTNTAGGNGTILNMAGGIAVNGRSLTMSSHASGTYRSTLLSSSGSNVWNGPVTLVGDYLIQLNSSGFLTFGGSITGSCSMLLLRGSGNGLLAGQINIGTNMLGKTDAGSWKISSTGNTWSNTLIAVGTIQLGASQALPPGTAITFGQASGTSAGTLDLGGFNQRVGDLIVAKTPSNQVIGNSSTTSDSVLTFDNPGSSLFGGIIKDVLGVGTKRVALVVQNGSLTLTNANPFSGGVTVNGTLLASNLTASSIGTGSVTVNSGGTLGGVGLVPGPVVCAGTIAPGMSAGKLTFTNGLNLASSGVYLWELAALKDDSTGTPGADFDQAALTGGTLVLGGTSRISIDFIGAATAPSSSNPFWQAPHTWTVLAIGGTATNPFSSDFLTLTNGIYSAGYFTTTVNGGGSLLLNYTPGPVPPPRMGTPAWADSASLVLSFSNALKGAWWQVQYKSNLNQPTWSVWTTVPAGAGTTFVTNNSSGPQGYFRLRLP